jgi:hypothetical protein
MKSGIEVVDTYKIPIGEVSFLAFESGERPYPGMLLAASQDVNGRFNILEEIEVEIYQQSILDTLAKKYGIV